MPASPPQSSPDWEFRATPEFWKCFDRLDADKQRIAREKFEVFRKDPFHPSLGTHRINSLSVRYRRTIYSACLDGDLRAVFYVEGKVVTSVGIGSHKIYR